MTPEASVIGLGNMGSAIAHALVRHGHSTCVWNRTVSKSEPLRALGAQVAASALEAIQSSPTGIVCIKSYDEVVAVLDPVPADALAGRTIVNLTSGTPAEAHAVDALVTDKGGAYLDGHIPVFPRSVGEPGTIIMLSGPSNVWGDNEPVLRSLGPEAVYLGADVGASNQAAASASSFFHIAIVGFVESLGPTVAAEESIEALRPLIEQRLELLRDVIERSMPRISSGDFAATDSTIAVHLESLIPFREALQNAGQRTLLLDQVIQYMQDACDSDLGSLDLSALVDLIRGEDGGSSL